MSRISGLGVGAARVVLVLAAALGLGGCPPSSTRPSDSSAVAPDRGLSDGTRKDRRILPDLGSIPLCERRCLEQALHLCVGQPGALSGGCVECTKDDHCTKNPGAFGPTCDLLVNHCTCARDSDCSQNQRGNRCDAQALICTCQQDADCPEAFPFCQGNGQVRTCSRPCTSDEGCPLVQAPRCDLASGRCVACLSDKDCLSIPEGGACQGQACGCAKDTDCQGTAPWGAACGLFGPDRRCGCLTDTDCTGNAHGPACASEVRRCTCSADSQCTTAPFSRCFAPYRGAPFNHCQAPCASDADCLSRPGLAHCELPRGRCVECLGDGDCPATAPHCQKSGGQCLACLSDSHCPKHAPFCNSHGLCKECTGNADCASSRNGRRCLLGTCGCTGDQDCSGPLPWASVCSILLSRCACTQATHCAGNANGPQCETGLRKCTCQTDNDCLVSPYTRCGRPYLKATYSHCLIPCLTDGDCAGRTGLGRCKLPEGVCRPCLSDSDCAGRSSSPACDAALGCVACTAQHPCTSASEGSLCNLTSGLCYCNTDGDCQNALRGKRCHSTLHTCGCLTSSDCRAGRSCNKSGYSLICQ